MRPTLQISETTNRETILAITTVDVSVNCRLAFSCMRLNLLRFHVLIDARLYKFITLLCCQRRKKCAINFGLLPCEGIESGNDLISEKIEGVVQFFRRKNPLVGLSIHGTPMNSLLPNSIHKSKGRSSLKGRRSYSDLDRLTRHYLVRRSAVAQRPNYCISVIVILSGKSESLDFRTNSGFRFRPEVR